MPKQASGARRFLAAHPERLAGGAAVSDPPGRLAVEPERITAIKAGELPSWR
jgi:hypothetical protein